MAFSPAILTTHNTFYMQNGLVIVLEMDLASVLTGSGGGGGGGGGTDSLENRGNYAIFTIKQIELGDTLPLTTGRDITFNLNAITNSTSTAWKNWVRTK